MAYQKEKTSTRTYHTSGNINPHIQEHKMKSLPSQIRPPVIQREKIIKTLRDKKIYLGKKPEYEDEKGVGILKK